ncbi:MAG: SWIM zinc finger family protein [Steroidobacteraceae bacterium]
MNWWNYARKPGVTEQRQRAAREAQRLAKRLVKAGRRPTPVVIDGRTIARSFWGKAWCENLESYRDYEYRLPRGRSYLRNGAVLDLEVGAGRVTALVSGSRASPYEVDIKIKPVTGAHWTRLKSQCAGGIGSLIELLEGRLSDQVMQVITHREQGLFPKPAEIEMSCSCPDWATMCKHVAAVLYGVGARFDREPALLFTLRQVDHGELIAAATDVDVSRRRTQRKTLAGEDLGSVFGIELTEALRVRPAPMKRAARQPPGLKKRKKIKGRGRKGAVARTRGKIAQ